MAILSPCPPVSVGAEEMLRHLSEDITARQTTVTRALILSLCFVFGVQIVRTTLAWQTISYTVGYLFAEYTAIAWILSPMLYAGTPHFVGNVVFIAGGGIVVESRLSQRKYLGFIITAGAISTVGAYLFKAPFMDEQIAAYGASGIGFALATYAVTLDHLNWPRDQRVFTQELPAVDKMMCLVGIVAMCSVIYDTVTGPILTVEWVNGAHLAGATVGVCYSLRDYLHSQPSR